MGTPSSPQPDNASSPSFAPPPSPMQLIGRHYTVRRLVIPRSDAEVAKERKDSKGRADHDGKFMELHGDVRYTWNGSKLMPRKGSGRASFRDAFDS